MSDLKGTRMVVVRSDYGLPYSKGLMAQSMTAAGLSPERSHALAAQIERVLIERNQYEIDVEDLRGLAEEVLFEAEGSSAVVRFGQWWRVRGLPRPLIVLLGGVTGVGKSTVASQLAARLGITRVIATDQVREVVRAFFSQDFMPAVHHSSFDVANELPALAEAQDPTIAGFLQQVGDIAPGIDALVARAVKERTPIVLEGVHLLPGVPDPTLCAQGITSRVVLAVTDEHHHRSHFHMRGAETPRDPRRYLEGFERIRTLQGYLIEQAVAAGIPVVDEGGLEPALKRVMEVVLDSVGASGRD